MANRGRTIGTARSSSPSPFLTATRKTPPNRAIETPPYTGAPHSKSTRCNPRWRLSDTTKRFAAATANGRPRRARRSTVDRTYSAVTATFASRTISTT
ncbi:hypothetical protein HU200_020388 [Digitaria exilis]|uniref:Uncharacterized protein n=1 Tax=Digitaria exilis TaxID=1010633 RepID=A0A835KH80_9POAL|nr:hypothetical protein HU200_020388 [Digitaria exilis]